MFDFSTEQKEKYFAMGDKLLVAAGIKNIKVDRSRISVVRDELIKVSVTFTSREVSADQLRQLKAMDNFTIVTDRYTRTKKGTEKPLHEEGYFTFKKVGEKDG